MVALDLFLNIVTNFISLEEGRLGQMVDTWTEMGVPTGQQTHTN